MKYILMTPRALPRMELTMESTTRIWRWPLWMRLRITS